MKGSFVIIILVLFVSLTPAHAFLNTGGSSGLLIIPDTKLQPQGSFTINYYNVDFNVSKINLNYGFTSYLELGFHLRSGAQKEMLRPHIKALLPIEETDTVDLAIGLLGFDVYTTLGVNLGVEGFDGFIGFGAGELGGLFLGLSRNLHPLILLGGDYVLPSRLVLEYLNSGFNLGIQLYGSEEIGMSIGIQDILGENNKLILGLQFRSYF